MSHPRRVLPLLALVAVAACGTTVPGVQQAGSGVVAGDGLAVTSSDSPYAANDAMTGTTTPGTTRAGGATGVTPGAGAAKATGSAPVTVAGGPPAASNDRTPVEVGFFAVKDLGPATKALGYDGLSTGDGKRQAQASIALLNKQGGLAGHPVKPLIFEYDATGNGPNQMQAACSLFFEDHKARALMSALLLPPLQACAAKAGVPFVTSGNRSTSAGQLARYPLTAAPPMIALDRLIPSWIASLKAQGYLAATSRVGLVYNEDPDFAGVPGMVEKALKSVGSSLAEKQSMPGTDDTSKVTAASNAGQSAALRFASNRVDRVLAVDKSGQALSYFALAAQNQNYYPMYGLSSLELPNLLRTVLSARSLQGARGIGWSPGLDLPVRDQPVVSKTYSVCMEAMRKAGEDMAAGSIRLSALAMCEGTLVLGAAWTDPALTSGSFASGLRALGTRFAPALTFAADFTRRPDGASRYRAIAFDEGRDSFVYSGPFQAAS